MIVRGLVLSLAAVLLAPGAVNGQMVGQPPALHARRVLELLKDERFADVTAEFNAQMTSALSTSQLQGVWTTLQQQFGAFVSVLDERVSPPTGGVTAVALGSQFERAVLNVIVAFDSDDKIAGLRMIPRPVEDRTPPPASSRFKEEGVTVGTGEWALPGTLSLPVGRTTAAVVLVHGSGPNDRDETLGPNKPFRDLAWGLADRGIAVLRYEKRTKQHGARIAGTGATFTVREEATEDAVLAARLLRSRADIDAKRIFVLGHSLGGTLAPRIAVDDGDLAGLIILAGASRPLLEVAREQLVYLSSLGPGAPNIDDGLRMLRSAAPESYWRDLDTYKPAEVAATLQIPMLILQGERDYQVTEADLEGWRQALAGRANVTIKSYPTLNHLFMPGEGKAKPEEYARPGKVAEFVVNDIADWIAGR